MDKSEQNSKTPWVKRMVTVVVLVALLVAFFVTDLKSYASYAWLQDNYLILMNFVDQNLVVAVLLYIAGYCLVVAASLPAATPNVI